MRRALLFLAAVLLGACGSPPRVAGALAPLPAPPPACIEGRELDDRLVIDWSPLDRSKLESAARKGLVAVRVEGCKATIVDGCVGKKRYAYAPTSRQRELIVFRDGDV